MVFRPQVDSIVAGASNIRGGENPPFTVDDFKALYPQFWDKNLGTPYIPQEAIDLYVKFAHACVNIARYRSAWRMCMGLFIAHFVTMYMQTLVNPEFADPRVVAAAGQTKGLMASKSVDGVSASYDFSYVMQDLDGWAAWKLTAYGVQFASLAKVYGMGGMRVP